MFVILYRIWNVSTLAATKTSVKMTQNYKGRLARLYERHSNLHSVESTQLGESTQILTQTNFTAWNKCVLNLSLLTWVRIWVTYFENNDCDWSVMTSYVIINTVQTIISCHIWCDCARRRNVSLSRIRCIRRKGRRSAAARKEIAAVTSKIIERARASPAILSLVTFTTSF